MSAPPFRILRLDNTVLRVREVGRTRALYCGSRCGAEGGGRSWSLPDPGGDAVELKGPPGPRWSAK